MKFSIVVLLGLVAFVSAATYDLEALSTQELYNKVQRGETTPETYSKILSNQAEKKVNSFLQQLRCGWPEAGIPPLAPYTNYDMKIDIERPILSTLLEFFKFRLDGLADMQINKLDVQYTFDHHVKFKFNFPAIQAAAQTFDSDSFIDLLRQWGLSVRYEGQGPFKFVLNNLSLNGELKYKAPYIFGSLKIYDFKIKVGLGSVQSHIGGILGNGRANELINEEIEYWLPTFVNEHQPQISKFLEEILVPRINDKLKGNKIWSVIFGGSSTKCKPTPAPFLAEV